MRVTIRIALLALVASVLIVSCQQRIDPIDQMHESGELRDLALSLGVEDMPAPDVPKEVVREHGSSALSYTQRIEQFTATKAGSTPGTVFENAIYDLNLFLVHTTLGDRDVRFFYFDALSNPNTGSPDPDKFPLILYNLFNGKYRLYTIANNGSALYTPSQGEIDERFNRCALSEQQIKEIKTTGGGSDPRNGGLLMSSTTPCPIIDLTSSELSQLPYTMTLERRAAKILFRYNVKSDFVFAAKYINFNNVATHIYPFSANKEPETNNKLIASEPIGEMNYYDTYVLENMRGNVSPVDQESKRSSLYAPSKASYLFLDGLSDPADQSLALGYQVYLGNGQVDNFDIQGNKVYLLTTTIEGDSQEDSRVSFFKIKEDSYSNISGGKRLSILVSYSNQYQNSFKLERTKMAGGTISNLEVSVINNDGSRDIVSEDGLAICDPNKTTEIDVKIDIEIKYTGSGTLEIAVTDKYFRTRRIIKNI